MTTCSARSPCSRNAAKRRTTQTPTVGWGAAAEPQQGDGGDAGAAPQPTGEPQPAAEQKLDWPKALDPSGRETRLGDALQQVIAQERGLPVSGIVVITDGGQNAGRSPDSVLEAAAEAKIPLYTVGVGSTKPVANARVAELEVPERVHPGDPYAVTGRILAAGLAGKQVTVHVSVRDPEKGTEQTAPPRVATLLEDGKPLAVKVQLTPGEGETGRRQITFSIVAPPEDRNPDDNQQTAETEIVDRKIHVLLFAGAATREYQFVRGLLHRDKKTTIVDVLLQTGAEGVSQESAKMLTDFPATPEALNEYDCIIAFDPRWQAPTAPATGYAQPGLSDRQMDMLEKWVGEQGGGMIAIAGPVNAGQTVGGWTQDPARGRSGPSTRSSSSVTARSSRRAATAAGSPAGWTSPPITRRPRSSGSTTPTRRTSMPGGGSSPAPTTPRSGRAAPRRDRTRAAACSAAFPFASRNRRPRSTPGWSIPRPTNPGADLHGRPVLRLRPRLLPGQRRDVAVAGGERGLLRSVLHAAGPPRRPGAAPAAVETWIAHGGQGAVRTGQHRRDPGPTHQCPGPAAPGRQGPDAGRPARRVDPTVGARGRRQPAGRVRRAVHGPTRGDLPVAASAAGDAEPPISRRLQVAMPNLEQETLQRNEPLLRQLADGFKDIQGRKLCEGKYYDSLAAAFGPLATAAPPSDPLLSHLHGEPRTLTIEEGLDLLWGADLAGLADGRGLWPALYRMAHPAIVETGIAVR